jgi:HlyD family secretion protein
VSRVRRPGPAGLSVRLLLLIPIVVLPACRGQGDRGSVYSGTIEAVEVDVVPEVSGRILERRVDQGDQVAAGDVVAIVDPAPYRIALDETNAALREARARLNLLRAGFRTEEVEGAARQVDEARAQVTLAEAQLRRMSDLFERRVVSQDDLDRARRDLDVARAREAAATQRHRLLERGYRPEEIEQAAAEAARLESLLAQRQLDLDRTTVRSPLQGTVTEKIQEPGEFARPGSPIVSVADLQHLFVWVYLNTVEQGRLKVGDDVSVQVDAYRGRAFPGRVVYVSPQAEFTPRNVQTAEDRVQLVFGVKVAVDNPDGALKAGLPADVLLKDTAASPAGS